MGYGTMRLARKAREGLGQGMVELALIAALASVVAIGSLSALGSASAGAFGSAQAAISAAESGAVPSSVRVTFLTEGDVTGEAPVLAGSVGDVVELPECTWTREDYSFVGWTVYGDARLSPGDHVGLVPNMGVEAIWAYTPGSLSDYSLEGLVADARYLETLGDDYESDPTYVKFRTFMEAGETYDFGTYKEGSPLAGEGIAEANTHVICRLVGVLHDDLSDGSGKAGLSFIATHAAPLAYQMNTSNTNSGGWRASKMRTVTLSPGGEVFEALPDAITDNAVAVDKLTNNTGQTGDPDKITVTSDVLWLPSGSELWGNDAELDGHSWNSTANMHAILPYEGAQYEGLAHAGESWTVRSGRLQGINLTNANGNYAGHEGSINRGYSYLRSPYCRDANFFVLAVGQGTPDSGYNSGNTTSGRCLVLGFCL